MRSTRRLAAGTALAFVALAGSFGIAQTAGAHDGPHEEPTPTAEDLTPGQRHAIRRATARFADVEVALAAGYLPDPECAEIGDVTRFPSPRHLASWSGLTPRHHESDTTVRRGHITKQGSRLVRWAALEAVARQRGGTHLQHTYHQLMERRNSKGIAKVAVVLASLNQAL